VASLVKAAKAEGHLNVNLGRRHPATRRGAGRSPALTCAAADRNVLPPADWPG
jgi:hypothetical protein